MNIHKNARATRYSRLLMARRVAGERAVTMAADFCVSEQTVRKWVRRWRAGDSRRRPCGGSPLRSHSLTEGPLPDPRNNLRKNDR
jgi:transposase